MSYQSVTAGTANVGGAIRIARVPSVIPGPPPPFPPMGGYIDMDSQRPLNALIIFDSNPASSAFTLGANLTGGGLDADINMINSSSTSKNIFLGNLSPLGTTGIASQTGVAGIDNSGNGNGLAFGPTGMTLQILGDTGAAGAVLTANGAGQCSWVGGAVARNTIGAASTADLDKLREEVRKLSLRAFPPFDEKRLPQ